MKSLYWFFGITVAVLVLIATIDPMIRQAVFYLVIIAFVAVSSWLMYQLVAFSSGYKNRLHEAAHRQEEV